MNMLLLLPQDILFEVIVYVYGRLRYRPQVHLFRPYSFYLLENEAIVRIQRNIWVIRKDQILCVGIGLGLQLDYADEFGSSVIQSLGCPQRTVYASPRPFNQMSQMPSHQILVAQVFHIQFNTSFPPYFKKPFVRDRIVKILEEAEDILMIHSEEPSLRDVFLTLTKEDA